MDVLLTLSFGIPQIASIGEHTVAKLCTATEQVSTLLILRCIEEASESLDSIPK